MSNYKYFGYCPHCGFETFETEREAKDYAEKSLEYFREEAQEGWSEDVGGVCWGKINQQAEQTMKLSHEECEKLDINLSPNVDFLVDYGLVEV